MVLNRHSLIVKIAVAILPIRFFCIENARVCKDTDSFIRVSFKGVR